MNFAVEAENCMSLDNKAEFGESVYILLSDDAKVYFFKTSVNPSCLQGLIRMLLVRYHKGNFVNCIISSVGRMYACA